MTTGYITVLIDIIGNSDNSNGFLKLLQFAKDNKMEVSAGVEPRDANFYIADYNLKSFEKIMYNLLKNKLVDNSLVNHQMILQMELILFRLENYNNDECDLDKSYTNKKKLFTEFISEYNKYDTKG